jgi:hypothetical protein
VSTHFTVSRRRVGDECEWSMSVARRKNHSHAMYLLKKQSNLHPRNHVPILILPRLLTAPTESISAIRLGLTRRRGHVFDGNPV